MREKRPGFTTALGAAYGADCMALFSALRDECISMVFADPPFNLGKDYGSGPDKDALDRPAYLRWCFQWIDEAVRVLKPGGAMFLYNLPQWAYHLAGHLDERGMAFRHWIAVCMKATFPRGKRLYPAHYALLYFTKGMPSVFNRDKVRLQISQCRHCNGDIKDYGGHRKYLNPLGLNLSDFWDDTAPARHKKFKMRAGVNELGVLIPARCIELSTNEGDVVLDPFGGGGSTYEAAERLGRFWIGTEILGCDLVRKRFEDKMANTSMGFPSCLSGLFKEPNSELRFPDTRKGDRRDGRERVDAAKRCIQTDFRLSGDLRRQVEQELASSRYRDSDQLIEEAVQCFLDDRQRDRRRVDALRRIGQAAEEAALHERALVPGRE
jgi:site-specific DNA-methyltransferase (adenine-specific)